MLLHGCPQSYIPNPVEGLLEVYEDMVEVLLVPEIFLTEDLLVEDLLCGAPSCSEDPEGRPGMSDVSPPA